MKQRYPGMKFHGDTKTFKDEELKEALERCPEVKGIIVARACACEGLL